MRLFEPKLLHVGNQPWLCAYMEMLLNFKTLNNLNFS